MTGLNVSGQDTEDCPHSKINMLGTRTEISLRATNFLLNIRPVDVEFRDTTLTVPVRKCSKQKKTLLKSVSGYFKSGELTAIMGPSGAGKSSLLHVLTGFIKKGVEGSITYSGSKKEKKDTCLIMQEDHLAPLFTVYEMMTISANLKLGPSVSRKAKHLLVEDILDMMGLSSSKDTRCNKLSGGQMKRLSIALELVSNPPVMFLDEPTTGLDSVSSLQCAKVLKTLAKAGRTIVCTIHQPCSFIMSLMDQVYILCDGQCVYQGTSYNMLPYLRQLGLECPRYHNPADFVMEVVCGEYGSYHTQLIQAAKDDTWRKSKHVPGQEPVQDTGCVTRKSYMGITVAPTHSPNEFHRFCILLKMYYMQLYRDWSMFHLKILVYILVGGLVGLFFIDSGNNGSKTISNLSYLFLSIVFVSYTTMTPAVMSYPLERARVVKEYFNNWYRLKTYYMALTLCSIPVQLFMCLLHMLITYLMTAQPLEWYRFTMMLLMFFLCILISEAFGIFFGTLFTPITGVFCGALYTAFLCLFGGFIILFTHMPKYLHWLSYFSFYRFCFDGMITSVYSYDRPQLECPEDVVYCHLSSPEYILKLMGVTGDSYWIDFGVLLLTLVCVRFVAYCTLKKLSTGN